MELGEGRRRDNRYASLEAFTDDTEE